MKVSYVFPRSHAFRAPFHEALRSELAKTGIQYDYVYSDDDPSYTKKDTMALPWATKVPIYRPKLFSKTLEYQAAFSSTKSSDLVILQQENGLLGNYPIMVHRWITGKPLAYFGHGKNFQAANADSLSERFKALWSRRATWWFAYTELCATIVEGFGFPRARITVFNNAIDTSAIRSDRDSVDSADLNDLRQRLVSGSTNVGVYVGGIYSNKRIPFLLEAAEAVRRRVPDFHLLVIGDGPDADLVRNAAAKHDWIHAVGSKFGQDKSLHVGLAKVFLMPGLVGLAVLDSFAYGTPMVTTDLPYHSPEIDYLEDGVNGIIVRDSDNAEAYAEAVASVLQDDALRAKLQAGAATALETYTIENMAKRFAEGVRKALERSSL